MLALADISTNSTLVKGLCDCGSVLRTVVTFEEQKLSGKILIFDTKRFSASELIFPTFRFTVYLFSQVS